MASGEEKRIYKQIDINGLVQGVGFRPEVVNIATRYNILGFVKNDGGNVQINASGNVQNIQNFISEIENINLENCLIENIIIKDFAPFEANKFQVIESTKNLVDDIFLPKDIAVCDKCLEEMRNSENRRYNHPFISCARCGARFSILEKLPYDRENTSMNEYEMCDDCKKEYSDIDDRRFYAQTLACKTCGPILEYYSGEEKYSAMKAIENSAIDLKNGKILAIKGIGGYHFACDPQNVKSVQRLRELKGRDAKPFAIMFKNLEDIKNICYVNEKEEKLLTSMERPIVLLNVKNPIFSEIVCDKHTYGCFLPYTPLQHLLLERTGALVMTSANAGGAPIIKDDNEIFECDVDGILTYKRDILRRIDDSVMCVINNKPQTIRIGRGIAPLNIKVDNKSEKNIFAAGSDLKNNFCLLKENYATISQYMGDLEDVKVNENYKNSVADYFNLYNFTPDIAVCDMHPNYYSSELAKNMNISTFKVQHHHAHIASVMAEHNVKTAVIGVCFDGTGYGTDGNIWGGEFLICEGATFERAAHLPYVKLIGGDESMRDAKKIAYCYLNQANINVEYKDAEIINRALEKNVNTYLTSSMGRIFDAVSSILDICHYNTYEGECAIKLEQCAEKSDIILPTDLFEIIREIYKLKNEGISREKIAYGFHMAICKIILDVCEKIRKERGIKIVCLSGGVFQNKLLCELSYKSLAEKGFEVLLNEKVPPNDGCISLGQAYIGGILCA